MSKTMKRLVLALVFVAGIIFGKMFKFDEAQAEEIQGFTSVCRDFWYCKLPTGRIYLHMGSQGKAMVFVPDVVEADKTEKPKVGK